MRLLSKLSILCALSFLWCGGICLNQKLVVVAQTSLGRQLDCQGNSVNSLPVKGNRWALIVGVAQYRDGQINALKGSVNDAPVLSKCTRRASWISSRSSNRSDDRLARRTSAYSN
jgi:hypothetical protein